MALIVWDDSLSVKINSIDDQHKVLVKMINDFYDNIINKSSVESINKLVVEMKKYTIVHFSNEEKIMQKTLYPNYSTHKIEHDKFVSKVIELEDKLKSGKLVVSLEITTFLKDWLKNHIQVTDKRYSDYFIKNGIK
jgi:hemerythrin